MKRKGIFENSLIVLAFVTFVIALYMVFLYAPTERTMGVVQRIFYFHVPVAWVALLAYTIVFIGSVLYLWKRNTVWDVLAHSSAEAGFVFTTMFLISGSIWAKPIWGVWWTWEPRLTTALMLWFIYIVYLIVRSYATEESRGARFAAVVGIVGFVDIPIIILAITLWRTQHPSPVIFEGGLTPPMLMTLFVCFAAFTILYILVLWQGFSLRLLENKLRYMKEGLS